MTPTTISRILPVVARQLSLDPVDDREEILDEIDECRSLMFSGLGEEVRQAFFVRRDCVPLQQFRHDCRTECVREYWGVTLPPDVTKAEVLRIDGERIEIKPEFSAPLFAGRTCCSRDPNHQMERNRIGCNPCCVPGVDLGRGWPLPVDPEEPVNLGFRYRPGGENDDFEGDCGVSYIDLNGQHKREDVPLTRDITQTQWSVAVLKRNGITLPPGRAGTVDVFDDGRWLAEFGPHIDVPDHHRIVIGSRQCGAMIEIEDALHEPSRACFDSDSVETGDVTFWRTLLMWKDLHFKTKRTPSEERSFNSSLQILLAHARQTLQVFEADTFLPTIEPDIPQMDTRRAYNRFRR